MYHKEEFSKLIDKAFIEWRKRQIDNRQSISVDAFAKYLGFSRPIVTLWLNADRTDRMPKRDTFDEIFPKFVDLLGDEAYEIIGMVSPDPLYDYVNKTLPKAPKAVQKSIAEQLSPYTTDPIPNTEEGENEHPA